MKYLKMLPVAAIMLFAFSSCRECDKGDCSKVLCTSDIRTVTIMVKDAQGNAIVLDDHYTIRQSTQETIRNNNFSGIDGSYPVLSDEYLLPLQNDQDDFIFIGIKNGVEVVRETFTISADCCHVQHVGGSREVTAS